MAHRAAASGCALDPVPVLILRGDSQHTSVTFAGRRDGSAPPRICLAPDLLDTDTDPADRAWTIAHELSLALRYQWRPPSRLPTSARMLIVCCVVIAVALAAAVRSSLVNDGVHLGRFVVLSWVAMLMWWLVHAAVERREEQAADELAATVFGESSPTPVCNGYAATKAGCWLICRPSCRPIPVPSNAAAPSPAPNDPTPVRVRVLALRLRGSQPRALPGVGSADRGGVRVLHSHVCQLHRTRLARCLSGLLSLTDSGTHQRPCSATAGASGQLRLAHFPAQRRALCGRAALLPHPGDVTVGR